MSTIVIIGKNGQLGTELAAASQTMFDSVIATDHSDYDIANEKSCIQILKDHLPDVVINAAAYNAVPACEDNPEPAFQVNTFAIHYLARVCAQQHVRFITYSTDYVFDGKKTIPYEEDDQPSPLQMYGLSKYAGEVACRNTNKNALVIRTSSLYGGLTGSPVKGNFVLSILAQAKDADEIEVGSQQRMSPSYAVDVAVATLELLAKDPEGGIYHMANTGDCSWAEFAQAIVEERALSTRIRPVDKGGESGGMQRPLYTVLGQKKVEKYGISLPGWRDALRRYLQTLP